MIGRQKQNDNTRTLRTFSEKGKQKTLRKKIQLKTLHQSMKITT